MSEIGEDADLLTRSDAWLEEQRRSTSSALDEKSKELNNIVLAQRIKRFLQQKNLIPLQCLVKDEQGNIIEILIKIMKLPEALEIMTASLDSTYDKINLAAQLLVWNNDGYDAKTSYQLQRCSKTSVN